MTCSSQPLCVLQTCTKIDMPNVSENLEGNFPSEVGLCIMTDKNGCPVDIEPVFASDGCYDTAVVYISAYKRCLGRSAKDLRATPSGRAFLDSTVRKDADNVDEIDGGDVHVKIMDLPTVEDAAEDDGSRQLAYQVTFNSSALQQPLQKVFRPQDFVQRLIQVISLTVMS